MFQYIMEMGNSFRKAIVGILDFIWTCLKNQNKFDY